MADYTDTLNIVKKKLTTFLSRITEIDTHDIFVYTIMANLENKISSALLNVEQILNVIKFQNILYDESFESLSKEYNKKEKKLEEELRKNLTALQNDYSEKIQVLLEEIRVKSKEVDFEAKNLDMDIEFFVISSGQNDDLFEREYNDNMTRFTYQLQVAQDSYAENTIQFNSALEQDLILLEESYNRIVEEYDKDTERIIAHYQKNVNELNSIYSQKVEEYNKILTQNKNQKRKESMDLNDKIRSLATERTNRIQAARQEYNRKQSEAQTDKENHRQESQLESQKISREFIVNMTSLDEKIASLKKAYNESSEQEKRLLQYRLFELKNEQEKELEKLYENSIANRKQIKEVKSQYYRYYELERKSAEKTLHHLSHSYLSDTEKANYQKKLLDLDRNYDIKSILENESYNNKVFQEINNEFENEMNLQIQLSNLEFNSAANTLRTENTLKTLRDEKNSDEIDAINQIETEKLICQIKSIKFEIESFEEIRKLHHRFENTKYETTKNYKTVNNVLEIEKCKVLDTLNHSMYDLNCKSTQMVLDTSKETTALKNQEYTDQQHRKIARNSLILNSEVKQIEYSIDCLNREKTNKINLMNRDYYFDLDTLGHDFLANKFNIEYKIIMQNLSLLLQVLKQIESLGVTTLDYVFHSIVIRPEYFKIIRLFVREFSLLIFESAQRFINRFHNEVITLIHSRLDFEESLKYKGFYKNIEVQYKEDLKVVTEKKKKLESEIEQLSTITDNNKTVLFALDNDIFLKKRKLKDSNVSSKIIREEISSLLLQRHMLEAENQKNTKRILVLNKEVAHIDNQIAQINLSFSRQEDEIRKMQITNAQSYYELKRNLDRHVAAFSFDMSSKLKISDSEEIDFIDYEGIIQNRCDDILEMNSKFQQGLYQIVHRFATNELEATEKSHQILVNGYNTDISELERDARIEQQNAKNNFSHEEALRKEEIERFDRDAILQQNNMKQKILDHENMIKKHTQDIQEEMLEANETFYAEYYAICSNQKDITEKHKQDIENLELDYDKNRTMIFERFRKSKEQLKEMLAEYILSRNEILNHLPQAEKMQVRAINEEAIKRRKETELNYAELKLKNSTEKKEIQKNKAMIDVAFFAKQEEIAKEHRATRQKEKKNHLNQMKHLEF